MFARVLDSVLGIFFEMRISERRKRTILKLEALEQRDTPAGSASSGRTSIR